MNFTEYHAKVFAYELTRRFSTDQDEKLASALVDAQVDVNPHQVDAALFAFQSPLSKGAILADEVGLGKTIEAGLVISQKWAEQKRRILVITPANLRKQWHQELQEKFFLPCKILETKSYKEEVRQGNYSPFEGNEIVIASYQFVRSKAEIVHKIHWHLVVMDEAHRLRNVYKPSNVIANDLKRALRGASKLLLTATPLQNSILELYGLVSFVDELAFGDLVSFREQFANLNDQAMFAALKARLKPICQRTLRKQVLAYVPYTKRHALVEEFTSQASEDRLYDLVSEYLRRDKLQALPNSQRGLITLVLRKLLASSTFAIAGALDSMGQRLSKRLQKAESELLTETLDSDYEALNELEEEWVEEPAEPLAEEDKVALQREIADLEQYRDLARSIEQNSKGHALLKALERGFTETERLGAARKAIIFTESRKTQDYLLRILRDGPYGDKIVLFNGTNSDASSRKIYERWYEVHKNSDRITGSHTADMRSALVDYFRDEGVIMIATEAGAEGINLQFCSLVINYDLPWNPQRIEQRIGRCHRYGQRHDVVVVNFLNRNNEADQRVYELLRDKFHLFQGVFGASDEVLGAIESGVDLEKRIAQIYHQCRTAEEINHSFALLQEELSGQINEALARTRQQLLENFDEEVHEKLRTRLDHTNRYIQRYEQNLLELTQFELNGHASFNMEAGSFRLHSFPGPTTNPNEIPVGLYELPRRSGDAYLYRLQHPLAEKVLQQAKERPLSPAELIFDYTQHRPIINALEPLLGQGGSLSLSSLTVTALQQSEDYLIFAAVTDAGETLSEEQARRLFALKATIINQLSRPLDHEALADLVAQRKAAILSRVSTRNAGFFETEANKLDNWAEDQKVGIEREIRDLDRQIKEARRAATATTRLEEKLEAQKRVRSLETQRNNRRRALFDSQDAIEQQRDQLIADIEGKLQQAVELQSLFTIRWRLI